MEHGDGSWEKQQYQSWPNDELDDYTSEANKMANVWDDYASQLEELARKARDIQSVAEDEAGTEPEQFYCDEPSQRYGLPTYEELELMRMALVDGMRRLAQQIQEDLAEARRRGY